MHNGMQEAVNSNLRILIKESWLSVDPCNKSESHINSCMVHVKYKILFQGVFDNDMQASWWNGSMDWSVDLDQLERLQVDMD